MPGRRRTASGPIRGAGTLVGAVLGVVVSVSILVMPDVAPAGAAPGAAAPASLSARPAAPVAPAHDEDNHQDELAGAEQALADATAQLEGTRRELEQARVEAAAARTEDAAAQQRLQEAQAAEQAALTAAAQTGASIDRTTRDVGALARQTYMRGAGVEIGAATALLDAETPQDLSDRAELVEQVGETQGHTLDTLRNDRIRQEIFLRLAERSRAAGEVARLAAARAVERADRSERTAVASEARLARLAAEQSARVEQARAAVAVDQAREADRTRYATDVTSRLRANVALPTSAIAPNGAGWARPGTGSVTSGYGNRIHPTLGYNKMHNGVDFAVGDGIAYAAAAGVVVEAGPESSYGNLLVIAHGTQDGRVVTSWYAHLASFGVQPGQQVGAGQPIGRIGATGRVTGPHLHFEVRLDGEPTPPLPWLG